MSLTVTRRVAFNAGHRLLGHEGMCRYLHGHNYLAEFHVRPRDEGHVDSVGRVVDFAELKTRLKGWIDEHWDHGLVLAEHDENAIAAARMMEPPRYFLLPSNPTAEAMAEYLLHTACPAALAGLEVECVKVVLWETRDSCATAERQPASVPRPLDLPPVDPRDVVRLA